MLELSAQFAKLARTFEKTPDVTTGTMMRATGLKVGDRFFAFEKDGALVLKLPRDTAQALVSAGEATPFVVGKRVMKEWVVVGAEQAKRWSTLAKQAHRFVAEES